VKNILLCTFVKGYSINSTIDNLIDEYGDIFDNDKIFLFATNEKNNYILSYNLITDQSIQFYKNTVLAHRKKETNTMYTINAINELIKNLNNGILDKTYKIEWELYKNSLLVSNNGVFKVINTELKKIYNI
jgi:hypothetical protein